MTTASKSELQSLYLSVAREFAKRVHDRFAKALHSVVLYGSVARSEAHEESDIDLLVLADGKDGLQDSMHAVSRALDEENGYATSLSPLVMSLERLEKLRLGAYPIASDIIRQGEVIYDDGTFIRWRELGPVTPGPDSGYVMDEIEKAERVLADALLLHGNDRLESAADRAYYVMLHSCHAALAARGVQPGKTHSGVLSQVSENLIKTGLLEAMWSKRLSDAKDLREGTTYGGIHVDYDTVTAVIEQARELLKWAEELARKQPL